MLARRKFLLFSAVIPLILAVIGIRWALASQDFLSTLITDASVVFSVPLVSKPAYLAPITDSTFHTKVTRIGGDSGTTFTALNGTGTWGTDVRQHYNDDQAWNADSTLIALQNEGTGASPSLVFLDGDTYLPKYIKCSAYDNYDDRWHPSLSHKYERINVKGSLLSWFDVVNCVQTRSWTLPFSAQNDIAQNPSADGRFIALWDSTRVFVVDMDPQPPLTSYPTNKRIGPTYDFYTNCGISNCTLDHLYISPSAKYIVAIYEGDHPRVFDVDSTTLTITPHAEPVGSPECAGQDPTKGYVFDLGHEAAAMNSFDSNEEVIVGQNRSWCPQTVNGIKLGQTVMVRLKDNLVTSWTARDPRLGRLPTTRRRIPDRTGPRMESIWPLFPIGPATMSCTSWMRTDLVRDK